MHGTCVSANSCRCSFGYAGTRCDGRGTGVTIVIIAAAVLGGVLCIGEFCGRRLESSLPLTPAPPITPAAGATYVWLQARKGRKKPKKARSGYMKINKDGSYSMRPRASRELRTVAGRKHGKGKGRSGRGTKSAGSGGRRQLRAGGAGYRRPASGSNHTAGDLYSPVSSVSPDGTPLNKGAGGAGAGAGARAGGVRGAYRSRGGSTGYGDGSYIPPDPVQSRKQQPSSRPSPVSLEVVATGPSAHRSSSHANGGSRHETHDVVASGSLPRGRHSIDDGSSSHSASRGLHLRTVDPDMASPRTADALQAHWRRPGHSKLRSVLVHTAGSAAGSSPDTHVSAGAGSGLSTGYYGGGAEVATAGPGAVDGAASGSDGDFSALVASRMVRSAVNFRMPTAPKVRRVCGQAGCAPHRARVLARVLTVSAKLPVCVALR